MVTDRLVLRQVVQQDVAQIYKLRSNLEVNELVGRNIRPGLGEAKEHINKLTRLINNKECINWGICFKETDTLIGTICFWNLNSDDEIAEIGYELLFEFHGKGIMTEAIKYVLRYGFEQMNIKIVTAFPSARNKSSIALLVKSGFCLDNTSYNNSHDIVKDLTTYTLSRQKYTDHSGCNQ